MHQEPQGAFRVLLPEIQRALTAAGYVAPTPIQEQCIRPLLEGCDLLGSAQTGTGKTAAFTLPVLHKLAADSIPPQTGAPRALILAPTRELAAQIEQSLRTYGRYLKLKHAVIYGGVKQFPQVKALRQGVDILVATPGRLLDLMAQGHLRLNKVEVFVLDEVDRMLDMGFIPDIKRVLAEVPSERQTLFFSATMAPKIETLARKMTRNPARIIIEPETSSVERISQKVFFLNQADKGALLHSLLENPRVGKAIIFTQMKHVANRVVEKLRAADIPSTAIHGNKTQASRTKSLEGFKRGSFRVLVATDVAARGIDVDEITHVINYDLPVEAETYIHRIGRTARAGACGEAISFCSSQDRTYLRDIEKLLGRGLPIDRNHEYHCEDAFKSHAMPEPRKSAKKSHNRQGRRRRSATKRSSGRSHYCV